MKGVNNGLLIIAIIFIPFLLIASLPPAVPPPPIAWFDSNFFLRQEINYSIDIGTASEDDVIIPIIIDTSVLIADGLMLSTCADYRIADADQIGLTFKIENGTCDTNDTVIWVRADLASGNNTFYHYFNNLTAVTTGSTNATYNNVIAFEMDQDPDPQNYASDRYDLTDFSHTQGSLTAGAHGDAHDYSGSDDFSAIDNLDDAIPTELGGTFTVYTWVNFGGTRETDGTEKLMESHDKFALTARDINGYKFECQVANETNTFFVNTSTNISDITDTWHFYGCGVNSTHFFMMEGSNSGNNLSESQVFNGSFIGGTPSFTIKLGTDASNPGGSNNLVGSLDSFFIYNSSKTINYMKAVAFGVVTNDTLRNFTVITGG